MLIFAWDLVCIGYKVQKFIIIPEPRFQWNPRSPKWSLFFFLCRFILFLGAGLVFYGGAISAVTIPCEEWDSFTKVKEFREVSVDEKVGEDKNCEEMTWEERLDAKLKESREKALLEEVETSGRRKSF